MTGPNQTPGFHPSPEDIHSIEQAHNQPVVPHADGPRHVSTWTEAEYMEALADNHKDKDDIAHPPVPTPREVQELRRVMRAAVSASHSTVDGESNSEKEPIYCGDCGQPLPCAHASRGKTHGF